MELYNFKTPDNLFRGTDFWMLNGELTEENIVKQLTQMKDKGVYSFIARTYLGLKSDYPGPDFKEKTKLIIETSKKCSCRRDICPRLFLDFPKIMRFVTLSR